MSLNDIREIEWAEYFDEEEKVPYYVNINTNETQSDIPQQMKEWKDEYVNAFISQSNWRKRQHDGKDFYYDKLTKSSVWEPPAEILAYEASLVELTQQRYQEAARRKAQANSKADISNDASQDDNIDDVDDWNNAGHDDEYDSDRTPPNLSPNLYSPQNDASGDEDDVEGGYFYDEQQDLDGTSGQGQDNNGDGTLDVPQISAEQRQLEQERQRKAEILQLEKRLSARDAIMEPGLYKHVARYLRLSEKPPQEVVSSLCKGYVGYAQLTHVVCDWIQLAEQGGTAAEGGHVAATALKESQDNEINQFIADGVAGLIKSRFDATLADKLMDEVQREPEWLVDMLNKPQESMWRRLLIELSDEHRESILLNWCIRELSRLGYHREIAQVIRESDYFSVCNELLVDTLQRLGSAIAEGGSTASTSVSTNADGAADVNAKVSVSSLMTDLKRMCCSTEYMFIYSQHLLAEIMTQLRSNVDCKKRSADAMDVGGDLRDAEEEEVQNMWRRKMTRAREELEDHMVWHRDVRGFTSRGLKSEALPGESKYALQLTSGNQSIGVRGSALVTFPSLAGDEVVQNRLRGALESGLVNAEFIEMLFSHFFTQVEDASLDGTSVPGDVKYVVTLLPEVQALLQSLVRGEANPRSYMCDMLTLPPVLHLLIVHAVRGAALSSSSAESARGRYCVACVLALASCVNEYTRNHSMSSSDAVISLANKISHVTDICLNLGSLSSSLFTASKSAVIFEYMRESSLLSGVFLSWLEMKIHENLFAVRAKQMAVYPVFMQMLVVGINTYSAQRHQCFQIIKNTFAVVSLVASSDDVTAPGGTLDRESLREKDMSETSLSIQQDLMDLLVHLIGKGFIDEPFLFLSCNIDSMDKGLIQALVVKLLGSSAAPFSTEFVRALTGVLLLPRARECVESAYFAAAGAKALLKFRDDALGHPTAPQRTANIIDVKQRDMLDEMVLNSLRNAKGTRTSVAGSYLQHNLRA